jgi:hypothetical protein
MWLLSSRIYEFGPKTIEAASAKNVTEATLDIGELAYANAHQREVRERLREQSVVIRYHKVGGTGSVSSSMPL